MNSFQTNVASKLAEMISAIPPARRGPVIQSVVSFQPHASLDESFAIGPIRAAFAELWEQRFRCSVPIDGFRRVLDPPIPIRTVLAFSKLMLTRDDVEVDAALAELADHLRAKVQELAAPQLLLFPGDSPKPQSLEKVPIGESVSSLWKLVDEGHKFPTLYADPPWSYNNEASRGAAANHYPTMSVDEICAEPVDQLAADNAHLHLWTTNAFLRDAFAVIDAWGFRIKSCFVWIKNEIGKWATTGESRMSFCC